MSEPKDLKDRLRQAAELGDAAALARALEDGANAKEGESLALSLAAEGGHVECAGLLIEVSDPLALGSDALAVAARNGHAECVRMLIPVSNPKARSKKRGSCALTLAACHGHAECVRMLIPVSNPLAKDSLALRWAAVKGHADCVALLLPASDPLAVGSDGVDAAGLARLQGHMEVAGRIEAFMEAQALSESMGVKKVPARQKITL